MPTSFANLSTAQQRINCAAAECARLYAVALSPTQMQLRSSSRSVVATQNRVPMGSCDSWLCEHAGHVRVAVVEFVALFGSDVMPALQTSAVDFRPTLGAEDDMA